MEILQFLTNHWWELLMSIIAIVVSAKFIYDFYTKPIDQQIATVKSWLVGAVILAEKELGSGTGELKLRKVYSEAISKFPFFATLVTFEVFKIWVDDALITMKQILQENPKIAQIIENSPIELKEE